MSKELVACDIDDVIAANAEGFIGWSNHHFGTSLEAAHYTEDFTALWPGIDIAEIERRASLFHESDVVSSYGHIDQAAVTLRALGGRYRFIAATSRRKTNEPYTRAWIEQAYEGIFEDVIFAGIYDEPVGREHHLRTKADIYRSLQPDYAIDDQLKHCYAAAELGIKTVLFGDYPWNQAEDLPDGISRCKDWAAVEEYFGAKIV